MGLRLIGVTGLEQQREAKEQGNAKAMCEVSSIRVNFLNHGLFDKCKKKKFILS